MQPIKDLSEKSQEDLFRTRLDQILNKTHPVFRLAQSIDWPMFEREFGALFVPDTGRPGLPTRLMVGVTGLARITPS